MDVTMELACYAQIDARLAHEQAQVCIDALSRRGALSVGVGQRPYYLAMALERQEHSARMAAAARRLLGIVE